MSNHKPPPPPAPAARPRANLDERTTAGTGTAKDGGSTNELPGGKDPRDPQYPGPLSTSENVTTDEQKAAQAARKEDMTNAPEGYAMAPRAEQVESQVAAAENPLSPQSTTINEPHGTQQGLVAPPRPEGQRNPVPQPIAPQGQWRFDPMTGKPLGGGDHEGSGRPRRARLDDDDQEEETEVELAHPVMLTADDGSTHRYEAGRQKIPRSHADHWYLKQHLVPKKASKADDKAEKK